MPTRYEVPPPGPALPFLEWARLLVARLRTYLPGVTASARGRDRVTLRYDGRVVRLQDERGTYMIRCGDGTTTATTMALMFDAQRHDAFTAHNFAKTIAGHFDARHSVADR